MPIEAWFPIGFIFPGGHSSRLPAHEGIDWQIYEVKGAGRVLVVKESLATGWFNSALVAEGQLGRFDFGGEAFYSYSSDEGFVLAPLISCESPDDKNQALAFAEAMRVTREIDSESSLHDAIYVEKLSRLLPTKTMSAYVDDTVVLGAWLTGGVEVSVNSYRRLSTLMNWMDHVHLRDIIDKSGVEHTTDMEHEVSVKCSNNSEIKRKEPFQLAGRSGLEAFLNEHVVDIIVNKERYKVLGIDFPSSIILHGPPGCGKTFAIERLVEYLEWPNFSIEASSVASPYIHETSKKVAEVFEQAMSNAPSILIIDEMEAFLTDRQSGTGHHRVEEVAEFLRRIPEANKNEVLVIAMTNHIDMIDPAIQRRGRFDHVVKVDMASEEEVLSLLEKLLDELPVKDDVKPPNLAKRLKGRPLSDVAFVVREGARLAARSGESQLAHENLLEALESTPARDTEETLKRKIGF